MEGRCSVTIVGIGCGIGFFSFFISAIFLVISRSSGGGIDDDLPASFCERSLAAIILSLLGVSVFFTSLFTGLTLISRTGLGWCAWGSLATDRSLGALWTSEGAGEMLNKAACVVTGTGISGWGSIGGRSRGTGTWRSICEEKGSEDEDEELTTDDETDEVIKDADGTELRAPLAKLLWWLSLSEVACAE